MSVLTTGRKLPSKKSVGGLKAIYFIDYGSLGTITIVAGEITAFNGISQDFFKYDINGSSSLETTVNSSRDAGSIFYTQTLNVSLLYLDKATQEEIKLIATARPHVFVEDYNGNFLSVGLINGAETTGGSIVSGAAMGDAQSFTLTMEAMEVDPPFFTLATAVTADQSATQITPTA